MSNVTRTFSNKCLSVSYMGENWNNNLIQSIIEAGRTISYIETLNPSKADKFHLSIKQGDKRLFMKEFEKVVRFAIAKLKLKRVKIAFDTTEDLTWAVGSFHNRPSVYKHQLLSWQYLNVSIIEPYFIPLMSVPYRQIDSLDILVTDLLKYVKTLPITVDLALFDRGFYKGHLINFLNNGMDCPIPYLMLIPQRGNKIKEFVNETINLRYFKHEIKYPKDGSMWKAKTNIIARRIDDKTVYCYATNLQSSLKLVREYPKRWNIETGFRIHDEARIKSKSKNSMIRFFYHLLGMLLIILWRVQNNRKYYVFKRYLKYIEYHMLTRIST